MTKKQKAKLKASAADNYGGDLDVAIAASIMGEEVITRAGNQVPAGADLERIADIRRVVEGKQKDVTPYEAPHDSPELVRRPDHLNEDLPPGDPERPDSANLKGAKAKAAAAGDPKRSNDQNGPAAKADPKRGDDANEASVAGDPERSDRLNGAEPQGDAER